MLADGKRLLLAALLCAPIVARAQLTADYYRIETVPVPEGIVLEVGGLAFMPGGTLAVATRRGEVWLVDNPAMQGGAAHFRRFAHGLHEALGLAYHSGALFAVQRGELTRLADLDGDGIADRYTTVYSWPLEGNYHEYSYGPLLRGDGSMVVALNLAWIGFGASLSPWRGWMLSIAPDGTMTPIATGMRSPAGMGTTMDGALFYAENQGDWVGSGYITHVEEGDFVGNPAGLRWTSDPAASLSLRVEDVPDTGAPMFEVAKDIPSLKPPAVWIPHGILGISTSDIVPDSTGGLFGPFSGQLFVGDQGHSKITRVFLEKVKGVYQGAAFPFVEGFASGVLRLAWARDGSLFVGMTNRGWASTGKAPFGLQRLVWTGKVPFEVKEVRAMPDGFELVFTKAVSPAAAASPATYAVESFTYKYHSTYGSPPIRQMAHAIRAIQVSEDAMRVRIAIDELREGYVYQISLAGLRDASHAPLMSDVAYYTLNRIPDGSRLPANPTPLVRTVGSPEEEAKGPKSANAPPAAWDGAVDATLTVGTRPNLLFDVELLTITAGARVALTFNNDDDMLHNLVVTSPGQADDIALQAMQLGLSGHAMAYVPKDDDVLFHTALLEPGTSETIYFRAPARRGDYVFVCTFPGHAQTMRGILRVM